MVQFALLIAFAVCAGATVLLQMRYGMLCGRSEQADPQADPKALACHRYATVSAVCGVVFLVLCMVVGAYNR